MNTAKRKRPSSSSAPGAGRRDVESYLNEIIDYGGEPYTRADAIRHMRSIGLDQPNIDRWLQGYELGLRIRSGSEA